jgi:hypothetical protein
VHRQDCCCEFYDLADEFRKGHTVVPRTYGMERPA